MSDGAGFSARLLAHPEAKNQVALQRIAIAKRRVQNILDRDRVAHQKTLEQKIAEQGPNDQQVDPHLVGLAIMDLIELNRLRVHHHPTTGNKPWYANPGTPAEDVQPRLNDLAPLYDSVSGHGFGNLVGDALELVVFKCLARIHAKKPRYGYLGHFHLDQPKNNQGRYVKTQPPRHYAGRSTNKEPDFIQTGYDAGSLCIECKNYREWIYPSDSIIQELIVKSAELNLQPVLIARRLHYTTIRNFLEPAGIIAHESYYQYYPADRAAVAERVKHARSLGFTDVTASEEPHPRTAKFFAELLPPLVEPMSERWLQNQDVLWQYANDELNLAQLYNAIGSPASGKWQDLDEQDDNDPYEE